MEQKTDVAGYYKKKEGIIVNKDNDALAAYKSQKARMNKINRMETKLEKLESDMSEIKDMLRGLIK